MNNLISDKESILTLLKQDTPLLDVRAEVEFEKSSLQYASNIPILKNDERKQVGTCYKHKGQDAAIALGEQLVSGETKKERINLWKSFFEQNPSGALFCARGGLRSKITQTWLSENHIDIPRIEGGYKRIRSYLLEILDLVHTRTFVTIAGLTGSGKTDFLNILSEKNYLTLDLEGIAKHRGSAFGKLEVEQPTQASFENSLAIALLKLNEDKNCPIFIEKESASIGRCWLTKDFVKKINESKTIELVCSMDKRVENIINDYIKYPLINSEFSEQSIQALSAKFLLSLSRIEKKLGSERAQTIKNEIQASFNKTLEESSEQATSKLLEHSIWIKELLSTYYDPRYIYRDEEMAGNIIFKGNSSEAESFIKKSFSQNHGS